jgi:GT2 family glycosyltransferase
MVAGSTQHAVSVVISAYTERRWDDLMAAVRSVERQTLPALEIIVAVDRNPALLERVRAELPGAVAVANDGHDGAGGARNSGVAAARGAIVAFLDDDAVAAPRWIEELVLPFADPQALGAGGRITPRWIDGRPGWFPEEFDWVVGCTYRGMPETAAPVRNLIAANMAVRRDVFDALDGFRVDFGKVGRRSSPEETDLCIRALARWPERSWIYHPPAEVHHTVPAERGRWRYFLERCWYEGLGKGELAGLVGERSGLSSEWDYSLKVLPRGVLRGVADGLRGRLDGVRRAAAIAIGFAIVVAGFVRARVTARGSATA